MARDVGTHLLRTLAAAGVVLSQGLLLSLLAAYQREAEDAVADSYAAAALDESRLRQASGGTRCSDLHLCPGAAIDEFHRDPLGQPLVPNWARVWAGVPDAGPRLIAAVAKGPDAGGVQLRPARAVTCD